MSLTRTFALVLLPTLTFGAVILTGSLQPLRAAARALPGASLTGVMVSGAIDGADEGSPQRAFQGTQDPVRLALVVTQDSGGIVGFLRDECVMESFLDSTGTQLHDPKVLFTPFSSGARVLMDGRRLAVEIAGTNSPAEDASWIEARGELAVRIASERATYTSDRSPLVRGTRIEVGPFNFEVVRLESDRSGDGQRLELRTEDDLGPITAWHLVDGADSYRIERTSTMGFNEVTQVTLKCPEGVRAGALEIDAWKDAETVMVPFSVKPRVGSSD